MRCMDRLRGRFRPRRKDIPRKSKDTPPVIHTRRGVEAAFLAQKRSPPDDAA